ncbi:MAG: tetratricopeptide repeat protein [Saprospiraceae bacterium]|nr:tetratricopeptide repeat protein [Saprospiraceae bacterium]
MEYRIKLVDSIQYHANNLINSRKYSQAFEYAILCDALFEYYKSYPYAQTINNNYLKGLSLASFGRYAKGDSLLLVALDSSIKYYSENSLEVAKVGKVLGFTKHFLGNLKESEKYLILTLGIYEKFEGKKSINYLKLYSNLCIHYKATQTFHYAEENFKRLIRLIEEVNMVSSH